MGGGDHEDAAAQPEHGGGTTRSRTKSRPLTPPVGFSPPVEIRRQVELRCYACGRTLNSAAFAPDGSKASGFKSICRGCDREKSRRYYAANRERKLAAANERNARKRAARDPRSRGVWLCKGEEAA
jgi:hypothetical protein